MQSNPFVISGYVSSEYFCDREEETSRLLQEVENGNNVAIIATRRMGKSGLIKHTFQCQEVSSQYYTFFVDIYSTKSLREFVYMLSREIVEKLKPYGMKALQSFWMSVKSLQTGISFSPMGEPSFNFQLGDLRQSENTLDEIFTYLNHADKPCLVAIDEFQQIANYPEKNVEAILRTYVQQCSNARFIFSGSQRHTMGVMFTSPSRPFFQSVSMMHLESIDIEKYKTFAVGHFAKNGKSLEEDVVNEVFKVSRGITWYIQKLFNTLYSRTAKGEKCTKEMVYEALDYILSTLDYTYGETLFRMPEKQKEVFIAIAKEDQAKAITSGTFIHKYKLSSSSMVQSAVKGLLERDYITYEKGVYSVYDLFLEYWIRKNY
ncbi:MAG: ATPase [Paludibacteraceae bacterium]|nr:ATPase [Paludibacteraceae bacterium]